jgi:hypothetical protein
VTRACQLEWQHATVTPGRIAVPLTGAHDDYWLGRFHEARLQATRRRRLGNLPHLQIELRDREVAATGVVDGEDGSVRDLLSALVNSANDTPQPRAQHDGPTSAG